VALGYLKSKFLGLTNVLLDALVLFFQFGIVACLVANDGGVFLVLLGVGSYIGHAARFGYVEVVFGVDSFQFRIQVLVSCAGQACSADHWREVSLYSHSWSLSPSGGEAIGCTKIVAAIDSSGEHYISNGPVPLLRQHWRQRRLGRAIANHARMLHGEHHDTSRITKLMSSVNGNLRFTDSVCRDAAAGSLPSIHLEGSRLLIVTQASNDRFDDTLGFSGAFNGN